MMRRIVDQFAIVSRLRCLPASAGARWRQRILLPPVVPSVICMAAFRPDGCGSLRCSTRSRPGTSAPIGDVGLPVAPRGWPAARRRQDPRRLRRPSRGQGRCRLRLVGGGFALVGATLMWHSVSGGHGLGVPPVELSMERDVPLVPGARVHVRLRRPDPVRDRIDQRQGQLRSRLSAIDQAVIDFDGQEDREALSKGMLIQSRDERVARGAALERDRRAGVPCGHAANQAGGTRRWILRSQVEIFTEGPDPYRASSTTCSTSQVHPQHDDVSKSHGQQVGGSRSNWHRGSIASPHGLAHCLPRTPPRSLARSPHFDPDRLRLRTLQIRAE